MFRKLLSLVAALSVSIAVAAEPMPEVDINEVKRWGDRVVVAGEGPRSGDEMLFTVAMTTPENDADQWYVTLWGKSDSEALKKLRKAFETDGNLTQFVAAPPDPSKRPWAHFHVLHSDDATQAWRFKEWEIPTDAESPIVTITPPRNGKWNFKGKYVVVDLIQTKDIPDSAALSKRIIASVRAYCKKIEQLGGPQATPIPQYGFRSGPPTPTSAPQYGFRQAATTPEIGRDDRIPWNAPPIQAPFNPVFSNPSPSTPVAPAGLSLEEVQAAAPGASSEFVLKTYLSKPASKEAVAMAWMQEQMRLDKEKSSGFFFPDGSTGWSAILGVVIAAASYWIGKLRAAKSPSAADRLSALEIALRSGGTIPTQATTANRLP